LFTFFVSRAHRIPLKECNDNYNAIAAIATGSRILSSAIDYNATATTASAIQASGSTVTRIYGSCHRTTTTSTTCSWTVIICC
jgi:hypothetical protein